MNDTFYNCKFSVKIKSKETSVINLLVLIKIFDSLFRTGKKNYFM